MNDMEKLVELGRKYQARLDYKKAYNARRKLEMEANPNDTSHGKLAGYIYGCRCERCRAANTEHARRERRKKRERRGEKTPGTLGQERGEKAQVLERDAQGQR